MEMLEQELFAGFTVMQVAIAAVALIAVGFVVKKLTGGKDESPSHYVNAQCGCGWSGRVSKFNQSCPKCTNPLP